MTNVPKQGERPVTEAIVSVLAEVGVEYVVGMPGGYTMSLFSRLHEHPSIRVVQVREECFATVMAEAYGRLRGRPIVVMGQGEWIVGNAGQGLLEALLGSSPVIVLTEMSDGAPLSHHGHYQSGTGHYGAWDIKAALSGVTKRVMMCANPVEAVHQTQLAFKHAISGEPGPVAVVYHSAALAGRVGGATQPRVYPSASWAEPPRLGVSSTETRRAAELIRHARRPVIIAGNGVRVGQATSALATFAGLADAPIVTTASGKGVVVETDPLAAGPIGPFGSPTANTVLGESDVVIAVGTKLAPQDTVEAHPALVDPSRQTLIQIDIEPLNVGWTFPVDVPIVGDATIVLEAMCAELPSAGVDRAEPASERIVRARDDSGPPRTGSGAPPFAPRDVIELLNDCMPEDAIVTCDAGENRLFMLHWFKAKNTHGFLQPSAGGGMGYAVPAALGAKLARPELPAVAVCGDGGFSMSLHALLSAAQEKLPIGVIVLNNNALGWVLHGQRQYVVAAEFEPVTFDEIARSMGCEGVRPTTIGELREAVRSLAHLDRTRIIDVPTSLDTSFRELTRDLSASFRESAYGGAART